MRARLGASLLALSAGACLPTDTRPPPAEITVTVSSSEHTRTGIGHDFTVDGFDISFQRVLVSLGGIQVGDDNQVAGCSEYSDPSYTRLFDFVRVDKSEKLGLAYALGHCPFGYVVRYPNANTIVAKGSSVADLELMRTPGSDHFVKDAGVAVYVRGQAERGDETKWFSWSFRKRIGYRSCWIEEGGEKRAGIELASGVPASVNIEIQAEALFRPGLDPALHHFEPYARADADADGEITLDELATVSIDELAADGLYVPSSVEPAAGEPGPDVEIGCFDDERGPVKLSTLADYAYCTLVPRIARFQGNGACVNLVGRPPDDD
jgi:hypothetical protein